MGAAADDNNNKRCVWTHEGTTTSLGKPKWATEAGTSRETERATRQPDATMYVALLLSQRHLLLVELHLTEKRRCHLLLIPMIQLQTRRWSFPFAKFMKYLCCRVSDCCENKFEQTHFCNQRPVMWEVGFISVTALKLKDCALIYVEKLYRGGGTFHDRCRQEVLESLWKSRQNTKRRSYFSKHFFFLWATSSTRRHMICQQMSPRLLSHTVDLLARIRRDFSSAAGWQMSGRIRAEKQALFGGRVQGQSLTLCVLNRGNGW